jgi:hypothetical protein
MAVVAVEAVEVVQVVDRCRAIGSLLADKTQPRSAAVVGDLHSPTAPTLPGRVRWSGRIHRDSASVRANTRQHQAQCKQPLSCSESCQPPTSPHRTLPTRKNQAPTEKLVVLKKVGPAWQHTLPLAPAAAVPLAAAAAAAGRGGAALQGGDQRGRRLVCRDDVMLPAVPGFVMKIA